MPAISIGHFVPLEVDEEKDSHRAYVDLDDSRMPSSKAFKAAVKSTLEATEIHPRNRSHLTFLQYGRDMKDDDLERCGLERPSGMTDVVDYLSAFYSRRIGNSLVKLNHVLRIELPRRAEEASAMRRGEMPVSFSRLLAKQDDPDESVRSWFFRVLSDMPSDFVGFDEIFPQQGEKFSGSIDPGHVLSIVSDQFEVGSDEEYLDNEVIKKIWDKLWSIRRLMNGQVDLDLAQEYRNPALVRWFERKLVNPRSLPQMISGFLSKRGRVSFQDHDPISSEIFLKTPSGDSYAYVYYDALGQLVDDQGNVHEIKNLVEQLKQGDQEAVSKALGLCTTASGIQG